MKKKVVLPIVANILIIAIIVSAVIFYKPYSLKNGNDAVSAALEIPYEKVETECPAENYIMDLTLDTDSDTVYGSVTVKVHNQSANDLTDVCFRYFAPAIGKGSKITSAKNAETGKEYDVSADGGGTFFTVNMADDTIIMGESAPIQLEFTSVIPGTEDRYGYATFESGKLYSLTFCFPQVAFLENGDWFDAPYFELGETTYNEMSDYYVTLKAPEDYIVLGSGNNKTQNGVTTFEAKNIREMAIVACNAATVETKKVKGVKFNVLKPDYDYKNKDLLGAYYDLIMAVSIESVELYSKKVGSYIYDELDVIPMALPSFGGMEMPGLIQIGIPADDATIEQEPAYADPTAVIISTCHEAGHQWFYCALGNDQYHEAWLDESFTTYLEGYFIRNAEDYLKYANKIYREFCGYNVDFDPINSREQSSEKNFYINFPSDDYREYDYGMIYDYGENFFRNLEDAMGEKKFFKMLSDWYDNNLNTVVDGYAFIQHVMEYDSSEEVQSIINTYISEKHLR